ncbi:DUF6881 domain-containing protein [Rhizobium leguminosarum]|uniref:DUF6881 domain-containing protein n=1 Tax=Rhizobium leguminosarum TaxID=384 RepID=UPI00102FC8C4|nr:hypothetical protein [Rhizobium leguminosarum]TBG84519.1 hypothetical protein ELG69_10575 [Rhizobium leguminosarum]
MRYVRVIWKINKPEHPFEILTEIDELDMETRKVHLYPDGHRERADANNHDVDTELSYEPFPSIDEINQDPQFVASAMSQDDFEREWAKT